MQVIKLYLLDIRDFWSLAKMGLLLPTRGLLSIVPLHHCHIVPPPLFQECCAYNYLPMLKAR